LFAAIDEVRERVLLVPHLVPVRYVGWAIVGIIVLIVGFVGIWFWQVWWLYDPSLNTF
jgi:hypothetical protein